MERGAFKHLQRRGAYLWLAMAPLIAGILSLACIAAVDPYDVRPFGLTQRIAEHRYPYREWPLLRSILVRQPHDLVLLAGSSMMAVDKDMMREAFPEARKPINLSYVAPRPLDQAEALKDIARIPGLRRAIIFMDFSLMERRNFLSAAGEDLASIRGTTWYRAGDFSMQRAAASLHRLVFGVYSLPGWSKLDRPEFMDGARPVTDSASLMSRYREAVIRGQQKVFEKSSLTCGQLPYVQGVLEPFLRDMAARDVAVDLVFPALPYILHYDWIENRPAFGILLPGPVFDQFMVFKRCLLAARDRAGSPMARVISLETNDNISGDLRNYMDSAHLLQPSTYLQALRMLAAGEEEVTSATIADHETRLRDKVSRAGAALLASRDRAR